MSAGDLVVALLGCHVPLILRKANAGQEEPDTYLVVGPAYISHLRSSQALLGPLDASYKESIVLDRNGIPIQEFEDVESGVKIYDDPRLGPPPIGWRFLREYGRSQREIRLFESITSGKLTYGDPRLTPEELRKRGTKVEEFILV